MFFRQRRSSARIIQRVTKDRPWFVCFNGQPHRICSGPRQALTDARFYATFFQKQRIRISIAGPDLTDILTIGGR